MTSAYQCDFENCGHIWLAKEERARCAKCKRRNWNKKGVLKSQTPLLDVVAKPKKAKKAAPAPGHVTKGDIFDDPGLSPQDVLEAKAKADESITDIKIALEPEPEHSDKFQQALEALSGPKPKVGEQCPHGWASYLQCPTCNERNA